MTSLGAYYAYIISAEMLRAEQVRRAPERPRRSLTDRLRALAALLAGRSNELAARAA